MPVPVPSVAIPILYNQRKVWIMGGNTPGPTPPFTSITDMLHVELLVNTNAAANTIDTNAAVIAAPAAGSFTRIWMVHLGGLPARTGALWASVETSTGVVLCELSCVAKGYDSLVFPYGTPRTSLAVRVRESSDVATQSFRMVIHYTTETT